MGLSSASTRRSRGFALITVLWFLVLLSAIGIYMTANGRSETALAHNLLAGARAEAVSDAALAQVAFNETDPEPRNRWKLDGAPHILTLPGGTATVRLVDEAMKINPNMASATLMAALFQVTGADPGRAAIVGHAVADWVQPADDAHPLSARMDQYLKAGKTYGPPGAPLETLDDLQLVLGMTPQIFAAALPYLTIFSDTDAPTDLKQAPAAVAQAVALAARMDPDNNAAPNAASAPAAAPGPVKTANPADATAVIGIDMVARSADGGVLERRCVIRTDSGSPKGYVVLDWRRVEFTQ